MSKSPEHTPTPWLESEILDDGRVGVISSANEILIGIPNRLKLEDRKFIVRACNEYDALRSSHAALMEALKAIVGQPGRSKGHIAWCVSHEQPPKLCNCGFEAGRAAIAAAEEIEKHV